MKARIVTKLKAGILDPQGKAIEGALKTLGIEGIASVRQAKLFEIDIEGTDPVEVEALLKKVTEESLMNPIMEDYELTLEE